MSTTGANGMSNESHEPSRRKTWQQWEAAGEFAKLFNALEKSSWGLVDPEQMWGRIQRALAVAMRKNPELVAQRMLSRMATFTCYLEMRSEFIVRQRLIQSAKAPGARADAALQALEEYLPQTLDLQRHLCELLECKARVARVTQMARRGRILNDRAEKSVGRKRAAVTSASTTHPEPIPTNGKLVSRIDGLETGINTGNGNGTHHAPD
jgi:hypothetical protein